jgi:mono/diheme cytochrome c family protein
MDHFGMTTRLSLALAVAMAWSCASTQYGATDANLARAESGAPQGASLFERECAPCHGERGESAGEAPRVLGPGALPEYPRERNVNASPATGDPESLRLEAQSRPAGAPWRDPFRTARDLYDFISKKMPMPAKKAGTLSEEDYWAIVNFMLLAHGIQVPQQGVTRANASSVKL